MGECCSSTSKDPHESELNKEINERLTQQANIDQKIFKLLLLGSGSSGKSTLFKQIKCIHGWGLEQFEYLETRHTIRSNLVTGIIKLCAKSGEFYNENENDYKTCYIDVENDPNIEKCIELVCQFRTESFEFLERINWEIMESLGEAIDYLWKLPGIIETFQRRGNKFAFIDNMSHFFDKCKQIFKEDYEPTHEDVLKCKVRTTGMVEKTYEIKEVFFNIYDVGGQRNERKKWIHSFGGVTAVIFVAALNHFNAVLFEDESTNAMHESIALFEQICNSKWFRHTAMILFLNKRDLFIETLMNEVSLSVCFGRDTDWKGNRYWVGPDYHKSITSDDMNYFEYCRKEGEDFIRMCYHDAKKEPTKKIFTHVTTATDRSNIEKVFWDVQNIVIRLNLNRGGFIYAPGGGGI